MNILRRTGVRVFRSGNRGLHTYEQKQSFVTRLGEKCDSILCRTGMVVFSGCYLFWLRKSVHEISEEKMVREKQKRLEREYEIAKLREREVDIERDRRLVAKMEAEEEEYERREK